MWVFDIIKQIFSFVFGNKGEEDRRLDAERQHLKNAERDVEEEQRDEKKIKKSSEEILKDIREQKVELKKMLSDYPQAKDLIKRIWDRLDLLQKNHKRIASGDATPQEVKRIDAQNIQLEEANKADYSQLTALVAQSGKPEKVGVMKRLFQLVRKDEDKEMGQVNNAQHQEAEAKAAAAEAEATKAEIKIEEAKV